MTRRVILMLAVAAIMAAAMAASAVPAFADTLNDECHEVANVVNSGGTSNLNNECGGTLAKNGL